MTRIFFDKAAYPEEAAALSAFDSGVSVFGIDLTSPSHAVAALVAARRAGETCAVLPLLPDPFEQTLSSILSAIAATPNADLQNDQFIALRIDQLLVNDKRPSELVKIAEEHENAAALILRMADLLLIQAPGERDRWNQLHQRLFRRFALLPSPERPAPASYDESGLTIYAPNTPASALAPYVTLARGRRLEPAIVSAENPDAPVTSRVVWTPEWRALRSRALAAAGHHVVAPNMFRVDECDSRIFGYHPVDYRSMLGSVDAAFAAPRGNERAVISIASTRDAIAAEAPAITDGPRVSIIVRTFDRPALLERAIASIANQTYRNVEIVVVNNGGADVRELVTRAANGRPVVYEQMPERKTISAASNVGARVATGTYIGYLDDDDLLYGDHCARTVDVLERTKADLVFTVCVGEYAEVRGGEKHVLGYQIYLDRQYHADDIFVSNITPIHTIVHPRSLFDRFGYFDESLPVTDDWELWHRVAAGGGRFVRIDRATCEYSWRYDPEKGNMTVEHQWDFVHAYEKITQKYAHLIPGRTSIHAQQQNMLVQQRKRAEDAADPRNRAAIVISSMSKTIVPVAPDWERATR
ncbi:MAG TPA: glycosyltransferase [Candidatus Aquilonibacter sp.]|nr:glycosyltransferase [Candidatus Aquilonibacter sp.]